MSGQALTTAKLNPVQQLETEFARKRADVEAMMREQAGETPQTDRIFAVALTKYRQILNAQKPSDAVIDPFSVVDCVLQAAQIGLEAGSDQAYLVPYKGRVSLIVSPRGLIDLAFRHPAVRVMTAAVVREGDFFEYELGDEPRIKHRKNEKPGQRLAPMTHVYAVMSLANGGKIRTVLTAAEVAFYRSFSKSSSGPWFDNEAAMWEKTALKRMMAKGPRSPQMAAAMVENDQGHYVPAGSDDAMASPRTVDLRLAAPVATLPEAPALPLRADLHVDADAAFAAAPIDKLLDLLDLARETENDAAGEMAFAQRVAVLLGTADAATAVALREIVKLATIADGSKPRVTISRALAAASERLRKTASAPAAEAAS